ncbi:MAG: histidine kinase [Clostridia bacterium]|nr:histidine kinase [Clostridia bacterium]
MLNKNFSVFWRKYGFKSIAVKNSLKLFCVFLMILIIPISIIYNLTLSNLRQNSLKMSGDNVKKIGATLETLIRDTEYMAVEMLADNEITYFLTSTKLNDYNINDITDKIAAYMSGKNIIQSVYLYNETNDMVCNNTECVPFAQFADQSWRRYYELEMPEKYYLYSRNIDNTAYNVFTLIKKKVNGNGGIILNIDLNAMERYISEFFLEDNGFYIVSKDGVMYTNLLKSKRNNKIEKNIAEMINSDKTEKFMTVDGDRICVSIGKSDYYGWYYVNVIHSMNDVRGIRSTFIFGVIIFLTVMFILIALAVVMSMNNISQIINILDLFDNREIYNNLTNNEISAIASKIMLLMDDNEKLKSEVQSRSEEYEKWKIKALQTQITPHFLNNTLAVINLKVIDTIEDDEDISRMISRLSNILDYTLITDKIFVTLREELSFIEAYISLLKLRYNNLSISINVPDEFMDYFVLRMSLQPIIENAVFYNGKEYANVYVECEKNGDLLELTITDNGNGMPEKRIEEIRKSFEDDDTQQSPIGVKNVFKRLKAAFGNRADINIISEEGVFSKVILTIPIGEKR